MRQNTDIGTIEFLVSAASEHGAIKNTLPKIVEKDIMTPLRVEVLSNEEASESGGTLWRVEVEYEVDILRE